jgi:RNA-binding protein NOB1
MLLREDQMMQGIWAQRARGKSTKNSMFGEEISEQFGKQVLTGSDLVVGFGRKNPNAQKGRERRGKKGRGKKK